MQTGDLVQPALGKAGVRRTFSDRALPSSWCLAVGEGPPADIVSCGEVGSCGRVRARPELGRQDALVVLAEVPVLPKQGVKGWEGLSFLKPSRRSTPQPHKTPTMETWGRGWSVIMPHLHICLLVRAAETFATHRWELRVGAGHAHWPGV